MMSNHLIKGGCVYFAFFFLFTYGCVTKKKKNEVSKIGKFYHNLTSEYNGYFNANELYQLSLETLKDKNEDNYSKILEVSDYISVQDPKIVNADLDKAIEKVTRVATLHDKGDWVDDCYLLMAKAQFLKQDYEKAEETLEYFEEEFNPQNPYGRNFLKKKLSSGQKKKIKDAEREEAKKEKEKANEIKKKEREELAKQKEEERKDKEKEKKDLKKDREKAKKEREKLRKENAKKGVRSKRDVVKQDTIKKNNTVSPKKVDTKTKEQDLLDEDGAEDKESKTKKKKEEVKDKTDYNEGLLWLARTYTRTEKYSNAEFLLDRIEKTPNLNKEVIKQLAAAQAEVLIKQAKYDEALVYLEKAINGPGANNDKARYAFIAAQISELNNDYKSAVAFYETAEKKAKIFELKFMAALGVEKSLAASGGKTPEQTVKSLEKFLKETKYAEFKDQIYFSLGEIAKTYDKQKAKEYYVKSNIFNQGNGSLRTESSYALAQIYLSDREYNKAKLSFDTTLIALSKGDDRYVYVKNMATNLTSIAKNIQIIERVDSLLAMGDLPIEELNKIARRRLEEEAKSGGAKQGPQPLNKTGLINTSSTKGSGAGFSSFFAYNLASVEAGKNAFKDSWGNRKLEDNWRRSSKSYGSNPDQEKEIVSETKEQSEELNEAEFKRIMADVPLNSFQKEQYKNEYKKALYELGKDYRDKIQEYALSAETLEILNAKFPGFDKEAEVYYYLFLDYNDLNQLEKARNYKNLLVSKYPNDKFTKIATDPNFLNALSRDAKKLDQYYDQSYEMFQNKQYDKVVERVQTAQQAFGKENKLIAKFSLLNAMCLGATVGKEAYIKALQEVVIRYPKTPEELKAKEILRFLTGDQTAFDYVDIQEVDQIYAVENEILHYIAVIILTDESEPFENAKISVSEYNKQFYSTEKLQMGESILSKDEKTQLILVRSFDNKDKAMKYYEALQKSRDTFISPSIANFEAYPITKNNYRKMVQDKSHKKYRAFFEKHYLAK